jgi:hypothetical protein
MHDTNFIHEKDLIGKKCLWQEYAKNGFSHQVDFSCDNCFSWKDKAIVCLHDWRCSG